jgi:hypothetical protein
MTAPPRTVGDKLEALRRMAEVLMSVTMALAVLELERQQKLSLTDRVHRQAIDVLERAVAMGEVIDEVVSSGSR